MQSVLDLLAGRAKDIELDRAALELASIEYPELVAKPFLGILDSYAVELSERLGESAGGADYVTCANQYLFSELGFKGNADDYYDPRNSCLNHVLTARTGIPITLAVVYLEVARRLVRPVFGIGLPGHFLVQYRAEDYTAYIDVFHGGRLLTAGECYEAARQSTGEPLSADARLLAPVGNRQIIGRMLRNLEAAYMHRRGYAKALRTLDVLLAADPLSAQEHKARGMLHFRMGNSSAARADLEAYLRLSPEASDRAGIEQQLRSLRHYQARMN